MGLLKTERLLLRKYTMDDLPKLHKIFSDPITMSFWPSAFTYEQSEQWIQRSIENYSKDLGRFAVVLQQTNQLIGDTGILSLEIAGKEENDLGYIISSSYWNHGFGFEAANAVMKYGFEVLKLKRICANMPVEHIRSRKVAEKLGMTLEKHFINSRNRDIKTWLYTKE